MLAVAEHLFADILFYWTARLIVPLVTLGSLRVEPLSIRSDGLDFNRFGVARRKDGRLMLSATAAEFTGLLIWFAIILAALLALRSPSP